MTILTVANLTVEQLEKLKRPFPAKSISFKIQTKPGENGKALVVAYIDARDVMDRLDEVAGPDWGDRYEKAGTPKGLVCYLTVCGVTRADVGDDDNDNEPVKSAYSDAFKRAAVKFGIGRFLYDLPKMWAQCKTVGRGTYLADGELQRLQKQIEDFLAGKKIDGGAPSGPTTPGKAPAGNKQPAAATEGANLKKTHADLWTECGKLGLLKDKEVMPLWSLTPKSTEEEIKQKIELMKAAIKAAAK